MTSTDLVRPPLRGAVGQFARLLAILRPHWGQLARTVALGAAVALLGLIPPYISKLLIDEAYPSANIRLATVLVLTLTVAGLTSSVLGALSTYYTQYVQTRLAHIIGLLFFNHLQHLPERFFDGARVGDIVSRFGDVRNSQMAISQLLSAVVFQGLYLLAVPPLLLLLEWRLALVAIFTLPIAALVVAIAASGLRNRWKACSEAEAELTAFQTEILSHIRQFKTMAMEHQTFRRAQLRVEHALSMHGRALSAVFWINSLTTSIQVGSTSLVALVGWRLVLSEGITLGTYLAFVAYLGFFIGPIMAVSHVFSSLQQSAVHMSRMFEYLDMEPEDDPRSAYTEPGYGDVITPPPVLAMDGVSFHYGSGADVLRNVSVVFEPGLATAIVGTSGAGKSTLLRLLARIEQPSAGRLLYEGRPAESVPLRSYRRRIASVWQDASLIHGSLWENLTVARPDAPHEVVHNAVALCCLDDFVANLPRAYETPVAEWGATVSGGQRQRIAIARALIQDAPVLILDEATSQLDITTEGHLLRNVVEHCAGRSLIFVTHRTAIASYADRIYVLADGEVQGGGSHDSLLRSNVLYRQLNMGFDESEGERTLATGRFG